MGSPRETSLNLSEGVRNRCGKADPTTLGESGWIGGGTGATDACAVPEIPEAKVVTVITEVAHTKFLRVMESELAGGFMSETNFRRTEQSKQAKARETSVCRCILKLFVESSTSPVPRPTGGVGSCTLNNRGSYAAGRCGLKQRPQRTLHRRQSREGEAMPDGRGLGVLQCIAVKQSPHPFPILRLVQISTFQRRKK